MNNSEFPLVLNEDQKRIGEVKSVLEGVISGTALKIYERLAEKLYIDNDGSVVPNGHKWNFVMDLEGLARKVRTSKEK